MDLHTFDPRALARTALRAGAVDVRTQTEELTAAFLGWPVRTFEAAVNPDRLGWGWSMFAYRSWLRLSAVDRLLGPRYRAALLQRPAHRHPAGLSRRDPRQVPLRRSCRRTSVRWVVRHRAWTPYYLVRYWRFLVLRLRHPNVVTRGMVFLGRGVELSARHGYGRIVLGRWVHLGDHNRLRAHEGTLRIGDKTVLGRENTLNCYLDIEIGPRCLVADWVYIGDFDHRTDDLHVPIKDQGIVKSPVRIGADVWVGVKASVLRGADVGAAVCLRRTPWCAARCRRSSVVAGVRGGWCATGPRPTRRLRRSGRRLPRWRASTTHWAGRTGRPTG